MLRLICKAIFFISGWKIVGTYPHHLKKCVVIEAPHTSMMDFVWGRMCFVILRVRVRFLIKKESFLWPLGPILKALGGIPVDRGKRNNMVEYVSSLFDQYASLVVTITPEGTRKYTKHWKKGFYYIAQKAGIPIIVGYLDYSKKEAGVGPVIWPGGNFEEDFKRIQDFYRGKTAKHPENFNLSEPSRDG